jgi:predicted GIY-YIG superfamily endonuclease
VQEVVSLCAGGAFEPARGGQVSPDVSNFVVITVYVLEGAKRRYVGITANLDRRLAEHRSVSHSGRLIGEFTVLVTENYPDYASARGRERFLKSGKGRAWLAERFPRAR